MIRSRFIFCALAIGLVVGGGSALERAWQADQGEDEGALPQVVSVDIARGTDAQSVNFDHPRAFVIVDWSVARGNRGLANRGIRWNAGSARTLLSLHTLLIE